MSIARFMQMAANTGEDIDPYFNQTTLLLHGDGTNGAQNNTFLDSSTNNFTITRNGNTTQGTFSPFSNADGEWSNYFDGTDDYLTAPSNSAFDFGSGDFTIEMWIYKTVTGSQQFLAQLIGSPSAINQSIGVGTYNDQVAFDTAVGSTYYSVTTAASLTLNTWNHIACVRNGSTLTVFINGTSAGTGSVTGTLNSIAAPMTIGRLGNYAGYYTTGYISNLRIVKGTAVYTSAFTPSTSPLTAISGTSLLTCQDNRFKDNSTNNFAITANGNVAVQPFSPFAPSAAYSPSVNGGSGYFDGSGDSLSITDVSSLLDFSTGAFTISLWFYKTNTTNDVAIVDARQTGSNADWFLAINSSDNLQFTNVGGSVNISGSTVIKPNQWYYVHVSRSGTTVSMYLNGALEASGSESGNVNCDGIVFGAKRYTSSGFGDFPGYLSSINIVSGTATSNAVPSAPTTGGTFLANFTNTGIFDNTGKNNLETVGNAQIDTTTKKFGTGSMEFDGTGDYLVIPNSPLFSFGSGPFTIELWIYPSATANTAIIDARTTADAVPWGIFYDAADMKPYFFTGSSYKSSTALSTGAWQHLAVTRDSSSTLKMFLDGVEVHSTGSVTTSLDRSGTIVIGVNKALNNPLTGFIDDLRITRGVARYTTTFTPPDKAFPDL